ncbi:MAG: type II secretion system F family protein [Pirellulales bacterium]
MITIIILMSAGLGVAALVGGVAIMIQGDDLSVAEDRLQALTAKGERGAANANEATNLLNTPLDETQSVVEDFLSQFGNFQAVFDQADVRISPTKFAAICCGVGVAGFIAVAISPAPKLLAPLVAIMLAFAPVAWLFFKRSKRINKINQQLPEALELLGRSLRAGHSLAAGIGLVASEMAEPISREFGRCFEEQNLGISLEEALESMTRRVPNLDVRFFATAVLLQRQTGGDLAEILDKIGRLIRARFRLAGQIQALTGEGRLSGIVLLALPPGLFAIMYFMNRDYCLTLFRDEMGRKMLAGALVMQVLGALVIRKIINIKV